MYQKQCLLEQLLLLTRISLSKQNLGQWHFIDPIWYHKYQTFSDFCWSKFRPSLMGSSTRLVMPFHIMKLSYHTDNLDLLLSTPHTGLVMSTTDSHSNRTTEAKKCLEMIWHWLSDHVMEILSWVNKWATRLVERNLLFFSKKIIENHEGWTIDDLHTESNLLSLASKSFTFE